MFMYQRCIYDSNYSRFSLYIFQIATLTSKAENLDVSGKWKGKKTEVNSRNDIPDILVRYFQL